MQSPASPLPAAGGFPMARSISQSFFREQTKSWYVQLGGSQHPLGKDEPEAYRL